MGSMPEQIEDARLIYNGEGISVYEIKMQHKPPKYLLCGDVSVASGDVELFSENGLIALMNWMKKNKPFLWASVTNGAHFNPPE